MNRYQDIVLAMRDVRVAVIGDIMLDIADFGEVRRLSPEAPVPVFSKYDTFTKCFLGGAANVAANVKAIGGIPDLIGVVGNDEYRRTIFSVCRDFKIDETGIVTDPRRITTVKQRLFTTSDTYLFRIDRECTRPVTGNVEKELVDLIRVRMEDCKIIIISDYAKGCIVPTVMKEIRDQADIENISIIADLKPVNVGVCSSVDWVTSNEREIREMTGIVDLRKSLLKMRNTHNCNVLLTRGKEGMVVSDVATDHLSVQNIPAQLGDIKAVVHVTGAGDTVTAAFGLGLATGASPIEAAIIASHAAGIVVKKKGTAVATAEELIASLAQEKDS